MTVNDASLGESGSKLSKVAATSLLMGVTRASSEAYVLALDIELPDKNVIPSEKGRVLASGKLSIKSKTIKEMNSDYLTSMLGVAYALASGLFNASAAIKNVDVMAHAQRMDSSTLQSRDTYLYAVSFERENFRNEVKSNLSPLDILILFPHLIKLTANNEMKPVDPERGILQ